MAFPSRRASGATRPRAYGATRKEKLPLTTWPSVESTRHSTRQAPAGSTSTVAVSQSADPSATRTVAGRAAPCSSRRRIVESFFSMRLLKRSDNSGGEAVTTEPAPGDDSSRGECAAERAGRRLADAGRVADREPDQIAPPLEQQRVSEGQAVDDLDLLRQIHAAADRVGDPVDAREGGLLLRLLERGEAPHRRRRLG